ncbi:bifunctional diguanylate cyclase/phosphodiesterase [Alkalihalobacterium chitinilyticum]|uniref:EAL domain-containing protein n=1 Tax=Alkalihalobacterium chitinilyticum TaxID=2980103 RepID=A0ABT5VDJ1_9BACI|nr:EAL domain-containing protein [Alkalihalobacterium chitinilyticum]MDE5413325.1 EAL domain-containing protein [Alkalihalobacterium chitinilyticum]
MLLSKYLIKMIWKLVPRWIVNMMGRVSFSKKFLLFFIAFSVPMIVIIYVLSTDINKKITQNEIEQQALISLQHFAELLRHNQTHRGLKQSYLRGYEEFSDPVNEQKQLVEAKIMDIDRQIEKDWKRFINISKWNLIKKQWEDVKNETNVLKSFDGHTEMNSNLLKIIATIVNEAHIYLNPDPQLNRLSITINEDLLLSTEQIGQLRAFSTQLTLQSAPLTETQHHQLLEMFGSVQLLLDNLEMKAYYLQDKNGEHLLLKQQQQFSEQTIMFIELLKSNEFRPKDPEIVFEQATGVINSGFQLYEKGNFILIEHLQEANKAYKKGQFLLVLLFLFSIFLIYLLFGGAFISVVQTLQTLQNGTARWIKGELGTRIRVNTNDELKSIGDSFNQLASSFEENLKENIRIQEDLQHSLKKNNQLATAINNLEIGVIITDPQQPNNPITFVNAGFEKLTGYKAEEVIGRKSSPLQGEKTSLEAKRRIREGIEKEEAFSLEILNYRKDGETFWNYLSITPVYENGKLVNFLGLQTDITKQKKAAEEIYSLAFYDQLTNLPNDNKLESSVTSDIQLNMKQATILRLDVVRFKNINHARGFSLGNLTLTEIARRLKHSIKDQGMVSRQYGDKYTVYLPNIADPTEINKKIEEIHQQFLQPFEVNGYTFYLEVSVGVSRFPMDGNDFITLMQHAEAAMFQAKEHDDRQYVYYQEDMHKGFEEEYVLENYLRVAIENEELFLTYQPKQDLKTGKINGMEALIRWSHPKLGMISPFKFIPLAEKTGLIYQIGEWVLLEACKHNKRLQMQGFDPLIISVNISAKQFNNKEYLLSTIDRILEETQLDPQYLEIELTESVFQNPTVVKPILEEIKQRDIRVSIDDFGTGYSSLSYLKLFPIDVLKIDRAFIKDLLENEDDQKLTQSMIDIGHGLNLKVIAEGVETAEHIDVLKTMNCDEVQGYHLAKPLTADEFVDFLNNNKSRRV